MNSFRNVILKNIWYAIAILFAGVILTALFTFYNIKDVENQSLRDLSIIGNEIQAKIDTRLHAHAQLLRNGSAFISASEIVSRKEWKIFYENSKLDKNLPGIQGFGLSIIIPKNHLQDHIQKIRKEGFPAYTVKPQGERDIYTSIIYLEPFIGRNLRAFGYDMFSEPIRRKAMEQARDYDIAALSGKVLLVQETEKEIQSGTLMYVPVYRKDLPVTTIEERRAAILGWVYSPYRMNDLMQGILGIRDSVDNNRIRLKIFDGNSLSKDSLLFDSQHSSINDSTLPVQSLSYSVKFNDKEWTLQFLQLKDRTPYVHGKVIIVIVSGIIISFLLFFLSLSLLITRSRANDLKESENKYRLLTESMKDVAWIVDTETMNYTYVSPSVRILRGYTQTEIISNSSDAASKSGEIAYFAKIIHQRISDFLSGKEKSNRFYSDEVEVSCKNGSAIWTEVITYLYLNDKTGHIELRGVTRDITERKKAEEMQHRIQNLESLGNLAGGIAHEFNNILTSIFGFIEIAKAESNHDKVVTYLNSSLNTMKRAKHLTQQLLTFAKGGAPIREIEFITPLIYDAVQPLLSESNISSKFIIPEKLWTCSIDREQIFQVIQNIVINAKEAMPSGGLIEISAKNIDHKKKEDSLNPEGNFIRISIKDNGKGISKDILPRIFDPFFTTEIGKSGLGLSISHSIIQRHDGLIEVESEVGKGSTFNIYLPANIEPKNVNNTSNEITIHIGKKILIMDDEESILEIMATILESLGYSTICVKDGNEALQLIFESKGSIPFSAIFLDLIIPKGIGGKAVISQIRKLNNEVPVFVISGYSDDPVMADPENFGFTASLSKPFSKNELTDLLNRFLKK